MCLLEPSYPTIAGPEYSNIAEAQVKELKTACMRRIEVLKEDFFLLKNRFSSHRIHPNHSFPLVHHPTQHTISYIHSSCTIIKEEISKKQETKTIVEK